MTRFPRTALALAHLLALSGGAALAQTFNIEINAHTDTTGMPVFFFEGASGQAGGWNNVNASSPIFALRNTDGALTDVSIKVEGQGVIVSGTTPGMTGALANVMADYHAVTTGLIKYTVTNLDHGRYAVYTYAGHPSDPNARSQVKVYGDSWRPTQVIGGPKNGTTVDPGDLYAVHVVNLQFNDQIIVQVEPFTGQATCAAIQLVRLPDEQSRLRVHVNDNATGDGHGGRWNDAMTNLQEAIRTATLAGGENVEIWTAQGTYRPTAGVDREATFRVPSGLHLFGGFNATETSLAQRLAPAFHITTLTGAIGGSGDSDNSYTVLTVENASGSTVIDGFTITRGVNTVLGVDASGGGVRIINSSPIFRNTKFIRNHATFNGAGVYVKSGSPSFVDCLFYENTLGLGAGAGLAVNAGADATVLNSQFLANHAGNHGGAAQLDGDATFINTLFDGNTAPQNGGAVNVSAVSGSRDFVFCTFAGNHAENLGGSLHSDAGAATEISNSVLWHNTDFSGASNLRGNLNAVTVRHSVVQNLQPGIDGVGNTTADPMFTDADGANNQFGDFDNNFRLRRGSPAIDAGLATVVPFDTLDLDADSNTFEQLPLDLDRKPRMRHTPYASGQAAPDMGAYEHQPTCASDLNGDRAVDFSDLNLLLGAFGSPSPAADTNADGEVNFADLNTLLAEFGAACPG